MKKCVLSLLLIIKAVIALAQQDNIEIFKQKLSQQTNDSVKIGMMIQIAGYYEFTKPDSALDYFTAALDLAKKNDYKRLTLLVNQSIARYKLDHGNFTEAFELSHQSMKQAIELKDTLEIWFSYRQILWLYEILDDNAKSMEYADRLLLLTQSHAIDRSSEAADLKEMSNRFKAIIFQKLHQDDSAFYYYKKALIFARQSTDSTLLALSYTALGDFYIGTQKYDSAFFYYRLSMPIAAHELRTDIQMINRLGLAKIFLNRDKPDSALLYTRQVITDAKNLADSSRIITASLLLSSIYNRLGKVDSAYKYLNSAVTLKDLLSIQEKEKNVRDALFKQTLLQQEIEQKRNRQELKYKNDIKIYSLIAGAFALFVVAILFYRSSRQKHRDALKIKISYDKLKATQQQLIQAEKMASLGELTAGIAHEIKNPLNFVNNFAEINKELLGEMNAEIDNGNFEEVKNIAMGMMENEEKIMHHGKRADDIVKGMLQHSRNSVGVKEPTDINTLAEEYLRLAYHGLRAKEKTFNATLNTDLDENLEPIQVIPQEIGRVILNLITNAFYAVNEKRLKATGEYAPVVTVSTRKTGQVAEIRVSDNGNGIPLNLAEKIFQPFFTTKPTGQGTGLGLSLSYDIVKAHGGELKMETREGQGATFIIQLPLS